ncbi:MAG TPA: hypothetical protein VGP70_00160 [Actinomadura sp.]|nr:hypothetical protein [Actinomadura sp.]
MADDWVRTTTRELERWARRRHRELDAVGARILLEVAAEGLRMRSARELTPERLHRLLLEEFPRVVAAGSEDVADVLATARVLVDFLAGTGAVPPEGAERLEAELTRIEPEFAEAIAAAEAADHEEAVEMLGLLMRADGIDPADEAAVEGWVQEFDALTEDERAARLAEHWPEPGEALLRPVRVAPREELAARARASELTRLVLELAGWAGERVVSEAGELAPEDSAAAAEALGLQDPHPPEDEPAGPRDLGGPARLWRAALHAGALIVTAGRVGPGPGLAAFASGDDEEVLARWLDAFEATVAPGSGPDPAAEPLSEESLTPFEVVRRDLMGVLIELYEGSVPAGRDELFDVLFTHIEDAYDVDDPAAMEVMTAYALDLALEELATWGVVEVRGDGARALTPLGVWAVRELLVADGYTAPLVGDLAETPAAGFLDGLALHGEDTAEEEIDLWLGRRDPADAAAELLAVMRTGRPGARNLAAAVLHRAGAAAEPLVRLALEEPQTRPYAALWLRAHGDDTVEPGADEMMWIFTDTVAGLLETAEPAEAVAAALADVPPGADLGAFISDLWRVGHPDITEVLETIGGHHPDRAVAKAARTAAFKARSRG